MTPHQTWTTTKPTKPGDYELSIEPTKRGSGSLAVRRVNVAWDGKHWLVYSGGGVARLADDYYQGALWREYVEPADPFEKTSPKSDQPKGCNRHSDGAKFNRENPSAPLTAHCHDAAVPAPSPPATARENNRGNSGKMY